MRNMFLEIPLGNLLHARCAAEVLSGEDLGSKTCAVFFAKMGYAKLSPAVGFATFLDEHYSTKRSMLVESWATFCQPE